MKTYLIIESYKPGKIKEIYQRFAEQGRMLPTGVDYIDSWIEEDLQTCYQLMRSASLEKINEWIEKWKDLVDFEIKVVLSSEEAAQKVKS